MKTIGHNRMMQLALFALLTSANSQTFTVQAGDSGEKQSNPQAVLCQPHKAPKDQCFICDPKLRKKGRLWCKEHGRYEDRCWECHPELQDQNRLYCKEHSLYEDECFLCHPELLKPDAVPIDGGPHASADGDSVPATAALMCREHRVLEQECGICHPDLLSQIQPGHGLKVRLPSAESATKAGVVIGAAEVNRVQRVVECYAELMFNQNQLAQIAPMVGGMVKSVEVDLGSRVSAGELLARVTSGAIGEAQSTYLQALAEHNLRAKTLERERNLRELHVSSEKVFQEAEAEQQATMAAMQQARQQLIVLGFDEQQIQALVEVNAEPGVLEIRAPFAGEIVERAAVQGSMVETGTPLFTLADTTRLWAMVNFSDSQLSRVQVGQTVELVIESLPGETFTGELTWLAANVDERTRMAHGRVEIANADGRLKAQMFARAFIVTSSSDTAVVVPQSALQNVEGTPVLFVKCAEDLFEARPVQLGARHNGHVEIMTGLKPGEPVVMTGSFALKSQFLISRLGAGCVDD